RPDGRAPEGAAKDHHHGHARSPGRRPRGAHPAPGQGAVGDGQPRSPGHRDTGLGTGAGRNGRLHRGPATRRRAETILGVPGVRVMKFLLLIFKNLRRNLLRTTLTSLAIMVLVFVVTLIWSVLSGLYRYTREQSGEQKLIVTEKWQIPSQMPIRY